MANVRHAVYPFPTRLNLTQPNIFGGPFPERAHRIPLGRHTLTYNFMIWSSVNSDTYVTGGIDVTKDTIQGKGLYTSTGLNIINVMGLFAPSNVVTTVVDAGAHPITVRWDHRRQLMMFHKMALADNPELGNGAVLNTDFRAVVYLVGVGQ